jgi:hypothetical protein
MIMRMKPYVKHFLLLLVSILIIGGCSNKPTLVQVTIKITDKKGSPVSTPFILTRKNLKEGEAEIPIAMRTDRNGKYQTKLVEGEVYILEVYSADGKNIKKEITIKPNMPPIQVQIVSSKTKEKPFP